MADSAVLSGLEAALLSLLFLSISLGMLLFAVLSNYRHNPLLPAAGKISFCAAVWVATVGQTRNPLLQIPVFWDLLSLTALLFLPVGLCDFVRKSIASEDSAAILVYLRRIHFWYSMVALIVVASNIIALDIAYMVFGGLLLITISIVSYISFQAIRIGDRSAKWILLGLFVLTLCAVASQVSLLTDQAQRISWLPQWGLLFGVCSLLAVIRQQISQADKETRRLAEQLQQENKTLRKVFQASKVVTNQVSVEKQLLAVKLRERSQRLEDAHQRITTDQETLQKTRNRLIEAERLSHLGAMVAGLAHELNTPLGVGVMAASNLEKEVEELHDLFESGAMKKSDLERHLQISEESAAMILTNLRGAAELIKSFKTVASDQNVDNRRVFPLKQYLEQILLSLKPMTAKTSHAFRVSCDEAITLYGQPGAFSQIITNFVTNSIVHAFGPEEAGMITIDAFRDQDHIALRYADNGRGIPPDVLPKIFEPFYTTRKGNEGTGLGLYIIHSIVTEQFGGVMSCESEESKGTTFYLRFPMREEQQYER